MTKYASLEVMIRQTLAVLTGNFWLTVPAFLTLGVRSRQAVAPRTSWNKGASELGSRRRRAMQLLAGVCISISFVCIIYVPLSIASHELEPIFQAIALHSSAYFPPLPALTAQACPPAVHGCRSRRGASGGAQQRRAGAAAAGALCQQASPHS
jgi:hypothetical protein